MDKVTIHPGSQFGTKVVDTYFDKETRWFTHVLDNGSVVRSKCGNGWLDVTEVITRDAKISVSSPSPDAKA